MTTKFIQLFENSGLTKEEFCESIQTNRLQLERYLRHDIEISSIEFKTYKERYDNYLKNKEE